jgi:NAD-dependent SIR2 family protein deacetylase
MAEEDGVDSLIDNLAVNVYDKSMVLLIAAGCSIEAGIPSGGILTKRFIDQLANDLVKTKEEICRDFVRKENPTLDEVTEAIKKKFGRAKIIEILDLNEWKKKRPIEGGAHHIIADLCHEGYFPKIITTNYDDLIEKGCDDRKLNCVVIRHSSDLPLVREDTTCIYKIHGCISRHDEIAITTNDLNDWKKGTKNWRGENVCVCLCSRGLLSVGYSASPSGITETVKYILDESVKYSYSPYWVDIKLSEPARKLLESVRAEENHIQLDSKDFFAKLQKRLIEKEIDAIYRGHVKTMIEAYLDEYEELKAQVTGKWNDLRSKLLSLSINTLNGIFKPYASWFDPAIPYLPISKNNSKIGKFFYWILLLWVALENVGSLIGEIAINENAFHLVTRTTRDSDFHNINVMFVNAQEKDISKTKKCINTFSNLMTMDSGRISFERPSTEHFRAPHSKIILFVIDNEREPTKNTEIVLGNIRERGGPTILRSRRGSCTATVLYETELNGRLDSDINDFNRFIMETMGVSNTNG